MDRLTEKLEYTEEDAQAIFDRTIKGVYSKEHLSSAMEYLGASKEEIPTILEQYDKEKIVPKQNSKLVRKISDFVNEHQEGLYTLVGYIITGSTLYGLLYFFGHYIQR